MTEAEKLELKSRRYSAEQIKVLELSNGKIAIFAARDCELLELVELRWDEDLAEPVLRCLREVQRRERERSESVRLKAELGKIMVKKSLDDLGL